MVAGPGRKRQNNGWQLKLGVREIVGASLGGFGLLAVSFALGVLAGRGEIYRVLQHWGLLRPETPKVVQPWDAPAPVPPAPAVQITPPASQVVADPAAAPRENTPALASSPAPGSSRAEAKTTPTPVKGAMMIKLPGASEPKKKAKTPSPPPDKKTKTKDKDSDGKHNEHEVQQLRAAIAPKLKFQNSLDASPPKSSAALAGAPKAKPKATSPQLIKVAQFREQNAAKARLADMQARGEKVTLQPGRDADGPFYAIYRQVSPPKDGAGASKKPAKPSSSSDTRH